MKKIRNLEIHNPPLFEVETRHSFCRYSFPSGVVYADTQEDLTEIYLLFLQSDDHLSTKTKN